jgi:hypothetical protein
LRSLPLPGGEWGEGKIPSKPRTRSFKAALVMLSRAPPLAFRKPTRCLPLRITVKPDCERACYLVQLLLVTKLRLDCSPPPFDTGGRGAYTASPGRNSRLPGPLGPCRLIALLGLRRPPLFYHPGAGTLSVGALALPVVILPAKQWPGNPSASRPRCLTNR